MHCYGVVKNKPAEKILQQENFVKKFSYFREIPLIEPKRNSLQNISLLGSLDSFELEAIERKCSWLSFSFCSWLKHTGIRLENKRITQGT